MGNIWITKNKEKINIKDLEDSHIRNILKMVDGYALNKDFFDRVEAVREEADLRGLKVSSNYIVSSKFDRFNSVIQVCSDCLRVDVAAGHEYECLGRTDYDIAHDDWTWK